MRGEFGVWDYLVLASMLVVSTGIGVFFALRGAGQSTQGEYLLANRSMSILPVTISILVSFISAILILGTSAEMYTQGTEYSVSVLGMCLGVALAALVFVPLFYPLKITSVFEYLEMRFKSRAARLMGSFLMISSQIVYMGIASYAPATAFETITQFPAWATILISGVVATFYTSIGGMKAVVWTDVFQGFVMLAGIMAIIVQGVLKVGGLERVWSINESWQRIKFWNFDPDPTVRHTFWSLVIGNGLNNFGIYGVSQTSVQRYSSLPTLNKAKISVILNVVGVAVLVLATCLAGLVIFAFYADQNCDPLTQHLVDNSNQLVPYFVLDTLGYPGVPGLFTACLFSGALSTVSSSLNSLAAISWEDILKPRYQQVWSESRKTAITKLLVVLFGVLSMVVSFVVQNMGGTVLQASNSFVGSVSGPMVGMFFLGAFFPWANGSGAVVGAIFGLSLSLWLSIGAYVTGIPLVELPHPNGTCPTSDDLNVTSDLPPSILTGVHDSSERSGLDRFYSISYLWFNTIGMIVTVVVGVVVSLITGPNSAQDVPTEYQIISWSRVLGSCQRPVNWGKAKCRQFYREPELYKLDETESLLKLSSTSSLDTSFNKSTTAEVNSSATNTRHVTSTDSSVRVNHHMDYGSLAERISNTKTS